MVIASNLGFPSVGKDRELEKAIDRYLAGAIDEDALLRLGAEFRKANWQLQKDIGIDHIPSNDFTFFDPMFEMSALLGVLPEQYRRHDGGLDLIACLKGARGIDKDDTSKKAPWFDTGEDYTPSELEEGQGFKLGSTKVFDEFSEALSLGIKTHPVLIGPLTYLMLSKPALNKDFDVLKLMNALLPVYVEVLQSLEKLGAEWVQIDEPILSIEQDDRTLEVLSSAYDRLSKASELKIMLATYYGDLGSNLKTVMFLPVRAVHFDLVRAPDQYTEVLDNDQAKILSLGVINAQDPWCADLSRQIKLVERGVNHVGMRRIMIGANGPLLQSTELLENSNASDEDVKSWRAGPKEKLEELAVLARAMNEGKDTVSDIIQRSDALTKAREASQDQSIKDHQYA